MLPWPATSSVVLGAVVFGSLSGQDMRVAVCLLVLVASASAGLFDLFSWDVDEGDDMQRDDTSNSEFERNCSCEGAACSCCMNFNLTFIDLGGPGCVFMKYVSPAEGIAVNISYGDNLLLSEAVKGANPEPACLDMLSDLAQMCARFSDLAPTNDGLRWCLQLEPTLLGESQVQYQLGCFRMGPQGMVPDPPTNASRPAAAPVSTTPSTEQSAEQMSEEELIAAVNESAEEGIAFFSNLLGLNFGGSELGGNKTEEEASSSNTTLATPTVQEATSPAE